MTSNFIMYENGATLLPDGRWRSKGGTEYNDEHIAKIMGCTHTSCDNCGKPKIKWLRLCESCQHIKDIEDYNSLEFKSWVDDSPVYSLECCEYFYTIEDIEHFISDNELDINVNTLRLVLTKPYFLREIDVDDQWGDEIGDIILPDVITDAVKYLNKMISTNSCGYTPTNIRTTVDLL